MKKQILAQMLTCSLIAGSSCVAFAAAPSHANKGDMPVYNLDPTVVTATRTPVKAFNANADVNVITAKDIETNHYQNLTDALKTVPGVVIENYAPAGYNNTNKIYINGSKDVVILINGVRAWSNSSSSFYKFPGTTFKGMDNIAKIEVLKGSASTLYGSDAKGGVINIITKTPMSPKSIVSVDAGSFGNKTLSVQNMGKEGKTSWNVYFEKDKSGDFKDGRGLKHDSKLDANTLNVLLKQKLDDKNTLSASYNSYHSDSEWRAPWEPKINSGDSSNNQYIITLASKFNDQSSNKFTFSQQNYKTKYYSQYRTQNNTGKPNYTPVGPVYWTGGNNFYSYKATYINDQYNNQINDKHLLTSGLDYTKTSSNAYHNGDVVNKAIYLQDQFQINDSTKLTSGLRYNHNNSYGSKLLPSINLGYTFNPNTNMYVSYSSYFIAPSLDQLFMSIYGNPNLKPETGNTKEIGLNHRFDKNTVGTIHVYKRNAKNMIGYNSNYVFVNIDKADTTGWDMQFKKNFDKNWSSFLGYTYTKVDSHNGKINYGYMIPKETVNLGVNYHRDAWNTSVIAHGNYGLTGTEPNQFPAENYWTWDMAVNYKANDNLTAYFKVNNIFDKYYAPITNVGLEGYAQSGEWWAAPGRSFILGMNYRF